MVGVNAPAFAKNVGVLGWNYNRANFKWDQGLRWQRYTTGRKMAMAQVGMFRQDITDLAGVSMAKLKVYGPIYGIVVTVCVTVLVEGRSGLKFPGPPVFISQIYLQCLCVGLSFVALAAWLLFHASMRAQIACVALRTRKVRVPVPTQRQLDSSRKILSTYEEQGLYDMFRVPFVLPNGATSPENSEDEEDERPQHKGYSKGGIPGAAAKVKAMALEAHEKGHTTHSARMPGFTPGNPSWIDQEMKERGEHPKSSPSGFGTEGAPQPYEHFEMLREAQKDWWGAEAYMRICFLYGMIHLVMAFSYWITLHNICELGMIWCSNLGAAGLTAGVWIIFRMDVLPEHGGAFPVELGGPFVTSVALGLMYSHTYTQTMIDVGRGVAAFIILMHVAMCFRMYSVAKPAMDRAHHQAKEAGGRLFNQSGSCDSPSWLPTAFQHVAYLVAPPKTQDQLDQEQKDRDNNTIREDPLARVDMAPWYYTRTMIFAIAFGWILQIVGHSVECVMGERMLVSNPGQPPWSRTGQWYGWEHGPVSSKHYAHVTPQRGHWAWQRGWGPQGQQELWASDMFGFHPEADAWWAEPEGPEPKQGAAGFGENTWAKGLIAYGQNEPKWGPHHEGTHDFESSGGHRRLAAEVAQQQHQQQQQQQQQKPRAMVPLPVQWPASVEPDLMACSPQADGAKVLALTASGRGAVVGAEGLAAATAELVTYDGFLELGLARAASWGDSGLLVAMSSGKIARCPVPGAATAGAATCSALAVPAFPQEMGGTRAVLTAVAEVGGALRVAVTTPFGFSLLELVGGEGWRSAGAVQMPTESSEEVRVAFLSKGRFVAVTQDGTAYVWKLLANGAPASAQPAGIDAPVAGDRRQWQSACSLPNGKIVRLASNWQGGRSGAPVLKTELLL